MDDGVVAVAVAVAGVGVCVWGGRGGGEKLVIFHQPRR